MPWSPSIVGSGGGRSSQEYLSSKQLHDIAELRNGSTRIEDIRSKLSSPSRDRDSFVSSNGSSDRGSVSPLGHDYGDSPPDMPTTAPPQTATKYVPLSERAGMLKNTNHIVSDDTRKEASNHGIGASLVALSNCEILSYGCCLSNLLTTHDCEWLIESCMAVMSFWHA